jgi:hypothetical protein
MRSQRVLAARLVGVNTPQREWWLPAAAVAHAEEEVKCVLEEGGDIPPHGPLR